MQMTNQKDTDNEYTEVLSKVVTHCYYLPPVGVVYRWLKTSSPATLISNYCSEEKISPPDLAHNTLNKALSIRPNASSRTQKILALWSTAAFPEQTKETLEHSSLTNEGALGIGAVSWVRELPHLKILLGEYFSYTLEVIDWLISEEKSTVSSVLSQDISPQKRRIFIYNNPNVAILFKGLKFPSIMRGEHHLVAGTDDRYAGYYIANTLLFIMASIDVEYTLEISSNNPNKGWFGRLLPKKITKKNLHNTFWEELKSHAVKNGTIEDDWLELAKLLPIEVDLEHAELHGCDPLMDSIKRTLNKYKAGSVVISDESLVSFIKNIFGDESDRLFISYFLRLKFVVFISNMHNEIKKELSDEEVKSLFLRYHTYYKYHQSALKKQIKG